MLFRHSPASIDPREPMLSDDVALELPPRREDVVRVTATAFSLAARHDAALTVVGRDGRPARVSVRGALAWGTRAVVCVRAADAAAAALGLSPGDTLAAVDGELVAAAGDGRRAGARVCEALARAGTPAAVAFARGDAYGEGVYTVACGAPLDELCRLEARAGRLSVAGVSALGSAAGVGVGDVLARVDGNDAGGDVAAAFGAARDAWRRRRALDATFAHADLVAPAAPESRGALAAPESRELAPSGSAFSLDTEATRRSGDGPPRDATEATRRSGDGRPRDVRFDYAIVTPKVAAARARAIEDAVRSAGLDVETCASVALPEPSAVSILLLGASDERLVAYAGAAGVPARLDPAKLRARCAALEPPIRFEKRPAAGLALADQGGLYPPFLHIYADVVPSAADLCLPFVDHNRHKVILRMLTAQRFDDGRPSRGAALNVRAMDTCRPFDTFTADSDAATVMVLHESLADAGSARRALHDDWIARVVPPWRTPVPRIREYLGDQMGFYFLFVSTSVLRP